MRTIKATKAFKKALKRANRDPQKDVERLGKAVNDLQENGSLTDEYKPHPLLGSWRPAWECHIQPDFLLIYQVTDDILYLLDCGSHADLFG